MAMVHACVVRVIAVLVLAAGGSSRMRGRDKLMEDVDGLPLLRRQVQRASATGLPVWVALPPAPHPRYDVVQDLDATLVPVADAADGMNASLSAGLRALPHSVDAVMIVLADMPDITTEHMNTVLQAVDLKSDTVVWRACTQDGAPGHPTVFRRHLFEALQSLSGDQGGSTVMKAHRARTVNVPLPEKAARTDLDTPEDWAVWRARQSST